MKNNMISKDDVSKVTDHLKTADQPWSSTYILDVFNSGSKYTPTYSMNRTEDIPYKWEIVNFVIDEANKVVTLTNR